MQIEQNIAGFFTPFAYENITVDNTVGGVSLTQTNVLLPNDPLGNHARLVVITSEGADLRYRVDGLGAPVAATSGHLFPNGSMLTIGSLQQMKQLRMIRETGTSATVRVTYYR
jgi:hypothetical protein